MVARLLTFFVLLGFTVNEASAQSPAKDDSAELAALSDMIGIWDAKIKIWLQGPEKQPMEFKGVETNIAHGKHWIASDFVSTFDGQKIKVHSIVGYDLDKHRFSGTVVDHGPYAASMIGEYDQESDEIHWVTNAKDVSGKSMVQRTTVKQISDQERVLTLMMPREQTGDFVKFMHIVFTKRSDGSTPFRNESDQ